MIQTKFKNLKNWGEIFTTYKQRVNILINKELFKLRIKGQKNLIKIRKKYKQKNHPKRHKNGP